MVGESYLETFLPVFEELLARPVVTNETLESWVETISLLKGGEFQTRIVQELSDFFFTFSLYFWRKGTRDVRP